MRLGKFKVSQEQANSEQLIAKLAKFVNTGFTVLEKIIAGDEKGKPVVIMIGISPQFRDIDDNAQAIPEYEVQINQVASVLGEYCTFKEIKK